MPPRFSSRRDARRPARSPSDRRLPTRRAVGLSALVLAGVLAGSGWIAWDRDRPRRLLDRAEAATRARDWPEAEASWRALNRTEAATARTLLAEARADLALDHAADALRVLERAAETDPAVAEVWQFRLDILRVLDRPSEALQVGRAAVTAVAPEGRRELLASTTLAALAEMPDDEARARLGRWIAADPADLDSRVALLARVAAISHPGDPDRASRIKELSAILDRDPNHIPAREALLVALADAGEPDRGRAVLENWPETLRDVRFDRLRGRWDLDYDRRPDRAAESYRRVLGVLPHDWKTHYGLSRALRALGQDPEAREEAITVARLRERLAPATVGPRLADDLAHLDDPSALIDLAALCEGVGLDALAASWRREALATSTPRRSLPTDR